MLWGGLGKQFSKDTMSTWLCTAGVSQPSREQVRPPLGDSAEDGDWDNCETVFNLDDVDASELVHAGRKVCRVCSRVRLYRCAG